MDQQLASADPMDKLLISVDPAAQARIWADLNLLLATVTNRFLLYEADAGRLDPQIVNKARNDYEAKYGTPMVEFFFDVVTQYELVKSNFETVMFHEELEENMYAIQAGFEKWGRIAEMISRGVLCQPDNNLYRCVHGLKTPLLMMRAPSQHTDALHEVQVKTLQAIGQRREVRHMDETAPQPAPPYPARAGDYMYLKRSIYDFTIYIYESMEAVVLRMKTREDGQRVPNTTTQLPPKLPTPAYRPRRIVNFNAAHYANVDGPGSSVRNEGRHGRSDRT
jgi:hypothetical protein